jgi:hypothetical protein
MPHWAKGLGAKGLGAKGLAPEAHPKRHGVAAQSVIAIARSAMRSRAESFSVWLLS